MPFHAHQDQYINAGNVKTRYWEIGDTGSAIILIHGLGASAEVWWQNIDSLAQDHRVLIPDLPGFGYSEQPHTEFSPFDYVQFLDDFMRALHIEKATVIGHSLGGGIALLHALQFPQKVEKLVLADCAGLGKEVVWTLRLMSLPVIGEILTYPTRIGVTIFFRLAVRNAAVITRDFIDTYYRIFNQRGFQRFLLKMTRMLVDIRGGKMEIIAPVMENLHKIKCPAMIIWGYNDRVFPLKHAYYGKDKMANARLHIMDRCGHVPNLEKPEEFNKVVLDFLCRKETC
jgi:pimeloyl-ACP methyl ester carboxylesterase